MLSNAWRAAVLGVVTLFATTSPGMAQDTHRLGGTATKFDGGATTFTLGLTQEEDGDTELVHGRRYYGGYNYYRPSYNYGYNYGYSYYRPNYNFGYAQPFYGYNNYGYNYGYNYNYYRPNYYRPAYYGNSYYGFRPICGDLNAVPTVTLQLNDQPRYQPQPQQQPYELLPKSPNPIERMPLSPAPKPQPQLQQQPQPLPQPLPRINPIPQDSAQERTFPYDGGPMNPVPMPQLAPEQNQPRPFLPTDGRPVSIPARAEVKKSYTYRAYGEK